MKLKRKLFINKRNGQGSITLTKDTINSLTKNNKKPKYISFEILTKKEVSELKKLNG